MSLWRTPVLLLVGPHTYIHPALVPGCDTMHTRLVLIVGSKKGKVTLQGIWIAEILKILSSFYPVAVWPNQALSFEEKEAVVWLYLWWTKEAAVHLCHWKLQCRCCSGSRFIKLEPHVLIQRREKNGTEGVSWWKHCFHILHPVFVNLTGPNWMW